MHHSLDRRHTTQRFLACVLWFSIFANLYDSARLSAEEAPALSTVRTAYAETTAAVRTLQYDMDVTWEPLVDLPPSVLPLGSDPIVNTTLTIVKDGRRVSRAALETSRSAKAIVQSWSGFDGSLFADWRQSIESPPGFEQLPMGHISASEPDDLRGISLDYFMGTYVFPDQSLERLLMATGARLVGTEPVDETMCIKAEMAPYSAYPTNPDHKLQIIAWFDPARGYLPRRIRTIDPQAADRSNGSPKLKWEYSTHSFQEFSIEGDRRVWLPVAGQYHNGLTALRFRVVKLAVNQPISDEVFRPDFPIGTLVEEKLPGKSTRRFFAGGAAGEARYRELADARKANQRAAAATTGAQPSIATRSRKWFAGPIAIATIVCVVAGAAFLLSRRSA